ncbi:hypothetical protein ACIQW5_20920 [Methylorubrum thiocyanatum]|jgi:hypothetical protein|uniref:hypothetical protein n=1 Tax=Methylorubrum thiocyanatum TaxID=47958 RepID=UPI00383B79F2
MFTSEADRERDDWELIRHAAVSLFRQPEALEEARAALAALRYDIATVICDHGEATFHAGLSGALRWEEQFGLSGWSGNLDALNDGFRRYPFGRSGCAALVLSGFQAIVARDRTFAREVLDIIEYQARNHLLHGHVLICLVETRGRSYDPGPLGARAALLNPWEQSRGHGKP